MATKKRKEKSSSFPRVKGSTRKARKKAAGKVPRKIAKKRPATKSRKKTRRRATTTVLGELLVTEVKRDLAIRGPGEPEPPDGGPGI